MQIICTSLQTDNHAITSSLNFFAGCVLFLMPSHQCQSTEASNCCKYFTFISIAAFFARSKGVIPRSIQKNVFTFTNYGPSELLVQMLQCERQGRSHVFCFGGRAMIWGAYDSK